jgi:hypothetical protein
MPPVANLLDYGLNERREGLNLDARTVHFGQQGPAFGIHEVDLAQIENGIPSLGGGSGRPPTLPQLRNPGARKPSFEMETEFSGAVVKRDLQHNTLRLREGKCVARSEVYAKQTLAPDAAVPVQGGCPNIGKRRGSCPYRVNTAAPFTPPATLFRADSVAAPAPQAESYIPGSSRRNTIRAQIPVYASCWASYRKYRNTLLPAPRCGSSVS